MDDELERLVVGVRADTRGFARDVADMRAGLEGSLGEGAERAARAIEGSLLRAVRSGKLGFDDLRETAVRALGAIAAEAVRGGIGAVLGGSGSGGGLGSLVGGLLGLPGRATGGPVSPGRAYVVGERGPEMFVPSSAGRVEVGVPAPGAAREVRVAITVNASGGEAAGVLARSSRQVARAVRAALVE